MKKETIKEYLSKLFVPRGENGKMADGSEADGVCFRSEYMRENSKAYPIYKAVSDCQFKSNLTFNFSYEIASRAVDILAEAEDWENDDDITERVDSACPIYTGEIMEIYQANAWAVDEAVKELGAGEDSEKNAAIGWYMQIRSMVEAIKAELEEIAEE